MASEKRGIAKIQFTRIFVSRMVLFLFSVSDDEQTLQELIALAEENRRNGRLASLFLCKDFRLLRMGWSC